jgi:DNA-binding response OmpR family regulator
MNILIVSEDRVPGSLIKMLDGCGIQSTVCTQLHLLAAAIQRDHPRLLLCYRLGSKELALVRSFKDEQYPHLPLFVISNSASALDRVVALQHGVSQYYLQPFSYTRLVYDLGSVQYTAQQTLIKAIGPFQVDLANQAISYRGATLSLSKKQYALLNLLLSRCNHVVSRVQIWETVWGLEQYPLANCIDALVTRVRQRLPHKESCKIEQVYGIGYRLLLPR